MPYNTMITNDGGKVYTSYSGNLTANEVLTSIRERFADIDILRKYKVIIADYTDVESFSTGNADVRNFADIYLEAAEQNREVIMVAIMPTDFQFGMGRMWEAHAHKMPWSYRVVRSVAEAESWLKEQGVSDHFIK